MGDPNLEFAQMLAFQYSGVHMDPVLSRRYEDILQETAQSTLAVDVNDEDL